MKLPLLALVAIGLLGCARPVETADNAPQDRCAGWRKAESLGIYAHLRTGDVEGAERSLAFNRKLAAERGC